MNRRDLVLLSGLLVVLGAGWGLTQPLTKIAVSTGYGPFGLIFWQTVIGAALMAAVSLARGRGLPMRPRALRVYLVIALVGTVIPDTTAYPAYAHLPSGVMSILLSLIPMIAFPMALGLGLERPDWRRMLGLICGLVGVLLLIAPESSLPDRAMLAWIPLALVAPVFYAFEGNYVSRWGTNGLDPVEVMFGASLVGAVASLPLALGTGQFISPLRGWGAAESALVAASVIHVVVYAGYVWMVGRAGAIFAIQVSYLVTGFGVVWAMLILGEGYSTWIWAAMALMMTGVFMVQPRPREALAQVGAIGDNRP